MLIYRNNYGDAALLAPTDREEILWGLVRTRFTPEETYTILLGLERVDVVPLLNYAVLVDYARQVWNPDVLRTALLNSGDLRALEYLPGSLQTLTAEEREQFVNGALFAGNVETITELYETGQRRVIRELSDIYLRPSMSVEALIVMFQYDGDQLSFHIPSATRQRLDNFLQAALATDYTSYDEIGEYRDPSDDN